MNSFPRRAAVVLTAASVAAVLAACGDAKESGDKDGGGGGDRGRGFRIGLALPENQTARYEKFDKPLIAKKIEELCGECSVAYVNAKQNAATQQQQVDSLITEGVAVLILDAVDSKAIASSVRKAKAAKIPVVAYDRLAEGPIDAYTSFDNETVGKVQGEALLQALGADTGDKQIVMMNGSPTDPNAAFFKKGAESVLKDKVTIGKSYDTTDWKPEEANKNMSGAISAMGKNKIAGVYSANDGMASGIISALKAAGVKPLPPVTGQDAELAGVQRIIAGEQFMSVYKPYQPEADAAARMAVALARGGTLDPIATSTTDSPTTKKIPTVLIDPVALTLENIKDTVVQDGLYTLDEICTAKYAAACRKAGLR